MMLSPYTVTIYTKQDNPYNVIPDAPIEIRERLANGTSGSLSIIYSDQEGLIPITQTGAKADSNGQFTFYAEAAQYNAIYESQTVPVDVGLTADTLPSTIINNLSLPYVFDNVADMVASVIVFPAEKPLLVSGTGTLYIVTSGASDDTENSPDLTGFGFAKQTIRGFLKTSTSSEPTHTQNPQFNTTNPVATSGWNSGGQSNLPNRLGHEVAILRDSGTLPTTFDIPVTFDVSDGQAFRNIVFTAQKNGFFSVFDSSDYTVTGYDTSTISITPTPTEMAGVTDVTIWVIGNDDQFIVGDDSQQTLQSNFGGYDNITNRQQSYNLGAHNLIIGTGDHATIWGATYSIIDASGSYNSIIGGTNNQIKGTAGVSKASGEGTRVHGSYTSLGGFNTTDATGAGHNFGWGRDLDFKSSQYTSMFGRDNTTDSGKIGGFSSGQDNRLSGSYSGVMGQDCTARDWSLSCGQDTNVAADHAIGWGFNGVNFGKEYSSFGGYQPVVRNAGSVVQGSSIGSQGDDQYFSLQLKNTIATGVGVWTRLLTVDAIDKVVCDGASFASITARVGVKLSSVTNLADLEIKAFYSNVEGVIGSTTTVLHTVGAVGATVDARIIEYTPGSASFSVEVTTGDASLTATASAKVDVIEFVS